MAKRSNKYDYATPRSYGYRDYGEKQKAPVTQEG